MSLFHFDIDGDGTICPIELGRAAEMYEESRKENKRLMKVVGGLLFVIVLMLVSIGLITNMVVQSAKETTQDPSGITLVAGTNTISASGAAMNQASIFTTFQASFDELDNMKTIRVVDANDYIYSYTPVSWKMTDSDVTFKAADGSTIKITEDEKVSVMDSNGVAIVTDLTAARRRLMILSLDTLDENVPDAVRARRLQMRKGGGTLSSTSSFALTSSKGGSGPGR